MQHWVTGSDVLAEAGLKLLRPVRLKTDFDDATAFS